MVFQKPNPFPKRIYENIAWGARVNGYKGNMDELVQNYTIIIVTHTMQQAARASDYTAYFLMDRDDRAGALVE